MPRVKITIVLLVVSIIGTASLSIWLRNGIIRIGYETEAFQKEKEQLLRDQKELIVQIEQLRRLERIEKIAVEQLGMKQPDFEEKVYVLAKGTKGGSSERHSENLSLLE